MDRCKRCIIPKANLDENLCLECRDNPVVQRILMTLPRLSHYLEYMPTCPRGYTDCVYDPAADGSSQTQTELWVRTDRFANANQMKIYNGSIVAKDYIEI